MDLDLPAVRAVVAVADQRSFSGAALALGVSQQAVSKRIAKLEADLAVRLFERGVGRTEPTEAGERFLVHARATLASANAAVSAVTRPAVLRVAVHGTQIADANLMQFYLDRHPSARIELLMSSPTRTSRAAVLSGRVDAGFARADWPAQPLPPSIRSMPAYNDELCLLVSRRHRLVAQRSVRLTDLVGVTAWVPGAGFDSEVGDFYQRLSDEFSIVIDTDRATGRIGFSDILARLAESDTLASFGGTGTTTPWHPDIVSVPIVDPTPAYPMALLWNDRVDRHPELVALQRFVREQYQEAINDVWTPDR